MIDKGSMSICPLMLIRVAGLPLTWLDQLSDRWPDEIGHADSRKSALMNAFDDALEALPVSPLRLEIYNARKAFFQRGKVPGPDLRSQLAGQPDVPALLQLLQMLEAAEQEQVARNFEKGYETAMQREWHTLQKAASETSLLRALLFASHDLLDRLPAFAAKHPRDFDKKDRRVGLALLRYLTRAVTKTSPLSRFTTISVQAIEEGNAGADMPDLEKVQVTPNVALLPAIYEVLLREQAFTRHLPLRLNPCIAASGQNRWLYFDGDQESFQQLEQHPVAERVIDMMLGHQRSMPFSVLLGKLVEQVDAGAQQLELFLQELIDLGLLEWELPEKGLSPAWCGNLYQHLGFLQDQPEAIVRTAELLQWLRVVARTIPHQSLEEARRAQDETFQKLQHFFGENRSVMPPVSVEQVFFEDVEAHAESQIPANVIENYVKDLAACWQERANGVYSTMHARIFSFALRTIEDGETYDFLDFCERFISENPSETSPLPSTSKPAKIGALLQPFMDENGTYRAVVNGLFPGGGKLFARWWHLFPESQRGKLKNWNESVAFPWQGWSNANFQPPTPAGVLEVPDGRTDSGGKHFLLGHLRLLRRGDDVALVDGITGKMVELTDLALEASSLRPPVMQVLWCLGVPYCSLQVLVHAQMDWDTRGDGWRSRRRIEFGTLVLMRAAWEIEREIFATIALAKREADRFRSCRQILTHLGVPRRFFAWPPGEKPQYFDQDSPLLMLLFGKLLRQDRWPLLLTEMLPVPGHALVKKGEPRAAEFVLEFAL
ncbi:MAG: lantibiotic dehydratase [Lewinellaceae bacterium]|nr:lantibiotic dehydratase [Lewinellaceae bacterium]